MGGGDDGYAIALDFLDFCIVLLNTNLKPEHFRFLQEMFVYYIIYHYSLARDEFVISLQASCQDFSREGEDFLKRANYRGEATWIYKTNSAIRIRFFHSVWNNFTG